MVKKCLVVRHISCKFNDKLYNNCKKIIEKLKCKGYKIFYIEEQEQIIRSILKEKKLKYLNLLGEFNSNNFDFCFKKFYSINGEEYTIRSLALKSDYTIIVGFPDGYSEYIKFELDPSQFDYSVVTENEISSYGCNI